jgi:hypothetical protein
MAARLDQSSTLGTNVCNSFNFVTNVVLDLTELINEGTFFTGNQ